MIEQSFPKGPSSCEVAIAETIILSTKIANNFKST